LGANPNLATIFGGNMSTTPVTPEVPVAAVTPPAPTVSTPSQAPAPVQAPVVVAPVVTAPRDAFAELDAVKSFLKNLGFNG
jgi:hypothetical protein